MNSQPHNDHILHEKRKKKEKKKTAESIVFARLLSSRQTKIDAMQGSHAFPFCACFFSAEWFTHTAQDEDGKRRARAIEDEEDAQTWCHTH